MPSIGDPRVFEVVSSVNQSLASLGLSTSIAVDASTDVTLASAFSCIRHLISLHQTQATFEHSLGEIRTRLEADLRNASNKIQQLEHMRKEQEKQIQQKELQALREREEAARKIQKLETELREAKKTAAASKKERDQLALELRRHQQHLKPSQRTGKEAWRRESVHTTPTPDTRGSISEVKPRQRAKWSVTDTIATPSMAARGSNAVIEHTPGGTNGHIPFLGYRKGIAPLGGGVAASVEQLQEELALCYQRIQEQEVLIEEYIRSPERRDDPLL